MLHFNFNSTEPIYLQVANQLEEAIFTKAFLDGTQVPSTTEISKEFHINPATVLKEMNILVKERILIMKKNKSYKLVDRNGAGKSTLLNIIANRLYADQGNLTLDDENLVENDSALGRLYLMNDVDMYNKSMRLDKIFEYTEQFYGSFDYEYAEKLAERFKIDTHQKFGKFSTGYHTIAKLIIALCVPADYIFLDEPVLGLDANHRTIFYEELM